MHLSRALNLFRGFIGCIPLLLTLPAHAALQIFTCEPEWAALAQELAGNNVSTYSATTAHQDVHHIQARPSLIAKVRQADLIICTGAELEAGWLPLLLQRAANPHVQPGKTGYFMAADHIDLLDQIDKVDRSMGDVHASGNPHFHLDPYRMRTIAISLAERLVDLDPDNSDVYHHQLQSFLKRWQAATRQWEQQAVPLEEQSVVVHHKDWRYLLSWLNMHTVASLEPRPGIQPSTTHLAKISQQLQQQPASMILRTGYQQARPASWVAKKTGVPVVVLPYTVGGNDAAQDLFTLYEDTINRLLSALTD